MEKRRPTYDLEAIKASIGTAGTLSILDSAFLSAAALGFNRAGIASVIAGMDRKMFVKSMTTYANHRVWQDVYNVPVPGMILYVKFQAGVLTEFTVVSFKEK